MIGDVHLLQPTGYRCGLSTDKYSPQSQLSQCVILTPIVRTFAATMVEIDRDRHPFFEVTGLGCYLSGRRFPSSGLETAGSQSRRNSSYESIEVVG